MFSRCYWCEKEHRIVTLLVGVTQNGGKYSDFNFNFSYYCFNFVRLVCSPHDALHELWAVGRWPAEWPQVTQASMFSYVITDSEVTAQDFYYSWGQWCFGKQTQSWKSAGKWRTKFHCLVFGQLASTALCVFTFPARENLVPGTILCHHVASELRHCFKGDLSLGLFSSGLAPVYLANFPQPHTPARTLRRAKQAGPGSVPEVTEPFQLQPRSCGTACLHRLELHRSRAV